ncbi:MAG: hypothetical protein V4707_05875 [Pseudomonadota bacterium]
MRSVLLVTVLAAIAAPAAAQSTIQVGQTVNGELSATDSRLNDGSYIDCYELQTQAGQRLQIDQTAGLFDSFLSVTRGGCQNATEVLAQDDDGGGGLNSRIVRDGDGGLWGVVANSIESGVTGGYQIRVTILSRGATPAAPAAAPASGSALPRVESSWATDVMTCHAAYSSMTSMLAKGVAPTEYGNVARIDYGARAQRLQGRLQGDAAAESESYAGNFEMMALVGAMGVAPNGAPNGHRPLAEYLTVLANCDRAFNLTPVTAY